MRIVIPAVALAALLTSGLSGCTQQTETTNQTSKPSNVPATPASLPDTQVAFTKTYTGNIDGKYGITMHLTRKGNDFSGTYYYNKVKQPISLTGSITSGGMLVLEERDSQGTITGVFEGTLYADSELTGKWAKPDSSKELPFSLKATFSHAVDQAGVTVAEYSFSVQGREDMVADFSFPTIQAGTDAAILQKINQQLSVQSLTDDTEEAIKKNFAECSCGLISSDFEVNYNKSAILSITVVSEWLGAYSTFTTKYINLNTQTGEPIKLEELLKPSSLHTLAALADKVLQERIEEAKKEAAGTDEATWASELLADKKFEATDLQHFTINENGLTFYYPFNFPHAALALEPDGAIVFTFEQLQDHLAPNGLLAKELK